MLTTTVLLTDQQKHALQHLPHTVREASELLRINPADWGQWVTPTRGLVSRKSVLINAITHDLNLLKDKDSKPQNNVYQIAEALHWLTCAPNPNRPERDHDIRDYSGLSPHLETLFILFVAPSTDYMPGYTVNGSTNTVTDVTGEMAATITHLDESVTRVDTYLEVTACRLGDNRRYRSRYAAPPATILEDVSPFLCAYTMLSMCSPDDSTAITVKNVPGVPSGVWKWGETRAQVEHLMRAHGIRELTHRVYLKR